MQANAAVANAYVADITPPERARAPLRHARRDVRHRLHPRAGDRRLLGGIDLRLPFFVAGGAGAGQPGFYGYFVLPESLPPEKRRPFEWKRANPLAALKRPGRS
jgi:DHA1 family tetracycline resistance protein-like MFS transporter